MLRATWVLSQHPKLGAFLQYNVRFSSWYRAGERTSQQYRGIHL
jgi:hypothetical protein